MGFGIFGNSSSSKQTNSWTSGSFPGAPAVHLVTTPGYSYASYSPVPTTVWPVQQQQQQFLAVSPYPVQQVPVPVPVPVQVAQPMTVVSPAMYAQAQSPTVTVLQQHTVTTTPGPNMLHLRDVPSPRISHVIPHRSPKYQQEHVQEQWYTLVPAQQQQQQVVYSQQPQQQQQQQQSPPIVFNVIVSPQQAQTPLPALGPPPSRSPRAGVPETFANDDDPSGGDDEDAQDEPPENRHYPKLRHPKPMPSPNTPLGPAPSISIHSPHPGLSHLVMPTSLPQLPSPYS